MKRVSVSIVGAGRLGTALAERLADAGYGITEIVARGNQRSLMSAKELARKVDARFATVREAQLPADLVWFCVPDAEISNAATSLLNHNWKGKTAVHSSGALTSDVLAPLRKKGAHTASVHPLMTFVRGSIPKLEGVPFAVEGDRIALRVVRRLIHDLGGVSTPVHKRDKIAYHAFATWFVLCSCLCLPPSKKPPPGRGCPRPKPAVA